MSTPLMFDVDLNPAGVPWPVLPPGVAVHRLCHAPAGLPEVVPAEQVTPEALTFAGRFEPRDTQRRVTALGAALAAHPELTHYLVFDTPFFDDLPEVARHYAVAPELAAEHGLYRTGRHGPVHRRAAQAGRCVTVALTASPTVAAVRDGRPLEISGGLSGLEGVPGHSTVGDIDPAAILYLVDTLGMELDAVERALTLEGGYVGLSADDHHELAASVTVHRLRRAIGSAVAVMDGLDALVFAGEVQDEFVERVAAGLSYLGVGDRVPVVRVPWTPLTAAADAVCSYV